MDTQGSRRKDLYGLVLAGGKSRRYGRPKQELDFHGMPQQDYLSQLLEHFCEAVFLSVKNSDTTARADTVPDRYPISGPLNGILSAFQRFPDKAWLCIACDMPGIGPMVLDRLLRSRDPEKTATCYWDSDGELPEPLLTVWEPKALPQLLAFYERGGTGPRAFLNKSDVHCITPTSTRQLYNVNTKEDHDRWKNT